MVDEMNVTVKRIAVAECLPKRMECEIPEGTTVRKLIGILTEQYGGDLKDELLKDGEISEGVLIMLNGLSLFQPDVSLDTRMKDKDTVLFAVMVYGG